VTLADGVRIGAHVVIEGRTSIGSGTEVHPFAMIGGVPGHLKDGGEGTELVIGARCSIREFVSLHRGTKVGTGRTVIGDECTFLAHSHVGHDCEVGRGVLMVNLSALGGHVQIGDYALISATALVHQFCRVGTMAMIEGNSAMTTDLPPYCLAVGQRSRLAGLNTVGLKRRGFTTETIEALRGAYRIVLRKGLPREEAIAKARAEHGHVPEVRTFLDFFVTGVKRIMMRHGRDV
jgi:UDP-N-acetylglucosamine acyltransferase